MVLKKIKVITISLFLFLCVSDLFPVKVGVLEEIGRPDMLDIDGNRLYITEGASIYIYSQKDLKLIKKFGKAGEGPGEFVVNRFIRLNIRPNDLQVISVGKLSYFTKNGDFIKETRTNALNQGFQPIGDKFAAMSVTRENNRTYSTLNIYDSNLKKLGEIHRWTHFLQGDKMLVFPDPPVFSTYDNKIFVARGRDFIIDAYDLSGKKLFSITYDYKKRKVTSEDKKMYHQNFSTDRHFKQYYPRIKNNMQFPDYFPALEEFMASDNKLYVWTHNKEQGKTEFLVFDLEGKLLKKVYLPFFKRNFLTYFPMTIRNNTLYQLIDNPDTETWELHAAPVF